MSHSVGIASEKRRVSIMQVDTKKIGESHFSPSLQSGVTGYITLITTSLRI